MWTRVTLRMSSAMQGRHTSATEASTKSPHQGQITGLSRDTEEEEEGGVAERDFPASGCGCVNLTLSVWVWDRATEADCNPVNHLNIHSSTFPHIRADGQGRKRHSREMTVTWWAATKLLQLWKYSKMWQSFWESGRRGKMCLHFFNKWLFKWAGTQGFQI